MADALTETSNGAPVPSRSRGPLITVVVLVLVLGGAGVAGALIMSRDDGPTLDGPVFAAGLTTVLDGLQYEDGVASIDDCPLGEMDDFLDAVASVVVVSPVVAEDSNTAYQDTESFPAGVYCNRASADDIPPDGPFAVSISISTTPTGDYQAFLQSVLDDETPTFPDTVEHEGGVIHPYCVAAVDEDGQTGCGADWVDEEAQVAVGIYLAGEKSQDEAVDALVLLLPVMEDEMRELGEPAA